MSTRTSPIIDTAYDPACHPVCRQTCGIQFNIAGAGIEDHLHYHNVPMWQGDHNFIAVLGELKTIPDHLLRIFDRLLPTFRDLAL